MNGSANTNEILSQQEFISETNRPMLAASASAVESMASSPKNSIRYEAAAAASTNDSVDSSKENETDTNLVQVQKKVNSSYDNETNLMIIDRYSVATGLGTSTR